MIKQFEEKRIQDQRDADTLKDKGCCRTCTTGKACGDSCISASKTCTKPSGCACQA